jgi:hypothetical protein
MKSDNNLETLQDNGILFEANRQFFHPLGLDLSVDGEKLSVTVADDEAGAVYNEEELREMGSLIAATVSKFNKFKNKKHKARKKTHGFVKQPLQGVTR